MRNSKLVHQFKVLEEGEVKRLLSFLKSPFYNTNPAIIKLYHLLRKEYPLFESPKLARDKVFKKLFPGRAYDHQKLLNLTSDFITLIQHYLRTLQLEKEDQVQDRLLLKAYAERPGGYDIFAKQIQKAYRRLDAGPFRNTGFYRQKFWLDQLYFSHPGTDKFKLSKAHYDAAMQDLDRWFVLEKLLLSCEMKAREKPLSEQYDIWLLPEIREGISHYPVEGPITEAYLEILDLLEKGDEATYFKLKVLLLNNLPQFTRLQQQNILQSLINYAIQQGNQGKAGFLSENLYLYRFGLSKELLLEHGLLNDMTFISIVNIALRTGESDWCRQFMEKYDRFLEPRARDDAKSLAMALWLYATHQPEATMDVLRKVEFLNVYYQIQARVLLIKVYFEALRKNEAYLSLTLSQAAAFERYLRRNKKIAAGKKEALLNFTLAVKRLTKWKTGPAFHQPVSAGLRQEIQNLEPLYNRSWLLRQLESEGPARFPAHP